MNSKDFIQLIRKVIREEVRQAVRTEFTKLNEGRLSNKTVVENYHPNTVSNVSKRNATKNDKLYSTNPVLNNILNQTGFVPSESPSIEMLQENIDYNDYSEWPSMNYGQRPAQVVNQRMPTVLTDINGSKIDANKLAQTESGAAVLTAVTKNYSELMKAIDKKKGK